LFFVHLLLADFTTGKDARLRRREKRIREARKRRNSISQHDELYVEDKR
jgi:phosphatidylinositol glycan class C protein